MKRTAVLGMSAPEVPMLTVLAVTIYQGTRLQYTISSGPSHGTYDQMGQKLATILTNHFAESSLAPHPQFESRQSFGALTNLQRVQTGRPSLGLR